MIVSDFEHKVFEYFLSSTSLLLGIHHVQQIFIVLILSDKLSPFGLVSNVAI